MTAHALIAEPAKLSAIDQAIADMPARAAALQARFREQDRRRGFSFGRCDYLFTAKISGAASLAERRARFEESQ